MATTRAEAIASGNIVYNNTGGIERGLERAAAINQAYLEDASALYEPYKKTGLASLDEYTKLLLGGVDSLSQDQNFQAMQDLAEKRVMANRATSGLLRSGTTANTLDDTLLNFANQYYSNRLNQLQSGVQYGTGAAGAQSSIFEKMGGNATDLASALANIQMQREGNQATINAAREQAAATKSAASSAAKSQMATGLVGAVATILGGEA